MLLNGANVVTNAIYIYFLLAFASVILALVGLAARGTFRYVLTAHRNRSRNQSDSSLDKATVPVLGNKPGHRAGCNVDSMVVVRKWSTRRRDKALLPSAESQTAARTPKTSDNESTATMRVASVGSLAKNGKRRLVYLMEQLLRLNSARELDSSSQVRVSEVLRPRFSIPRAQAEPLAEIREVKAMLSEECATTKSMALFRLVCLGSTPEPFANPAHFNDDVCDLMITIVDSLLLYSACFSSAGLQQATFDLATTFVWEHWNGNPATALAATRKSAANVLVSPGLTLGSVLVRDPDMAGNSGEPSYRHHTPLHSEVVWLSPVTVFRLFCNLYLGTPVILKEIRPHCVFKLSALFQTCARRTRCRQHRDLFPLLEQAVKSAERASIKTFFYEIAICLLEPHLFCCLTPEDVFTPGLPIRELISTGLWAEQQGPVRDKAAELARVMSDKFPDFGSWGSGQRTPFAGESVTGTLGPPGSWLRYQ